MAGQKKKYAILGLLIAGLLILAAWIAFELTVDDAKGNENPVKKVYYQAVKILPVKPAVKLAVAYHRQEHPLSCELAALLMALRYRGVNATESALIRQLPISDPGPRSRDNTWGDPNLGFVGNIDGKMPNTGYGVYDKPIYDLAIKYRPAKIIASGTLDDLVAELSNGNPVVVWGVVGRGKDIFWTTPEGQIVYAKMDEHARTLIGFTGQADKPQSMILLDPIYGEIRMKVADFLRNWAVLDKRAVVVY